jgi:hypothetical protein
MKHLTKYLLLAAMGAFLVAVALTAGATRLSAAAPRCGELPTSLRHACDGRDVTCTANPDRHSRWEAVLATEPTMGHAKDQLKRAVAKGFGTMHIEIDVRCSNGAGVYEVSQARFLSRTQAAEVVAKAKAAGFANARTEDS